MRVFEDSIPNSAKIYTLGVVLASSPVAYLSLRDYADYLSFACLLLVGFTAASSWFPIKIALPELYLRKKESFSITLGDVFVFTSILFFGPAFAALIAAVEGAVFNLRGCVRGVYKQAFNVAQAMIAAYLTGYVWFLMEGTTVPLISVETARSRLFAEAVLCAIIYFGLSSGLIAVGLSLVKRQMLTGYLKNNLRWAALSVLNALIAVLVFLQLT